MRVERGVSDRLLSLNVFSRTHSQLMNGVLHYYPSKLCTLCSYIYIYISISLTAYVRDPRNEVIKNIEREREREREREKERVGLSIHIKQLTLELNVSSLLPSPHSFAFIREAVCPFSHLPFSFI